MNLKIIKYIILIVFLMGYYFIKPINEILSSNINMIVSTRFLAKSLYDNEVTVSSMPLVVKDYCLFEDRLYIFPLDNLIVLPIDVMIIGIDDNKIEVLAYDERFTLTNFTKKCRGLYEYVDSLNEIAYTNDFFVIDGKNLDKIVSRLTIYYEKV